MSESVCKPGKPIIAPSVRLKRAEDMTFDDINLNAIYGAWTESSCSKPKTLEILEGMVDSFIDFCARAQDNFARGYITEESYSRILGGMMATVNTRAYFERFGVLAAKQAEERYAPVMMELADDYAGSMADGESA